MDDREMISAYLKGDLGAFDEFYSKYKNSLYTLFYRRSPEVAEDLFQITFHKFLRSVRSRIPEQPGAYLYTIACNNIRDHYRSKKDKLLEYGELVETVVQDEPAEDDEIFTETEIRQSLSGLARDRPQLYEVVHLHIYGGMTFRTIGEMMKVNVNTVASRYRYGLKYLRDNLQNSRKKGEKCS